MSGAVEAESLGSVRATSGKTATQKMVDFKTGRWSGDEQLVWTGGKPGDRLEFEIDVPSEGTYDVLAAFTMARDYAVVQPMLGGRPMSEPLDLYNYPSVISSGELTLASKKLTAGKHRLAFEIKGANPSALKTYMVGLDYLRLVPR